MKIPYPKIVSEIFHNLHNLQVEENSGYFHHLIRNDSMYAERTVDAGLFFREKRGYMQKRKRVQVSSFITSKNAMFIIRQIIMPFPSCNFCIR